ncbi:MAG: DUF1554 domain-containing protein, partial [Myxococcota bacterium]
MSRSRVWFVALACVACEGAVGPAGARGPEGPAGAPGIDGVDGAPGEDGIDAGVLCELAEGVKGELSITNPLIESCDLHFTVFVSSSRHAGDFGGLAEGDAICQARAMEAGLEGRYRAWLGNGVVAPFFTFYGDVPYRLVDGTQVSLDTDGLFDRELDVAIDLDETGMRVLGEEFVWTGVYQDGTEWGFHCEGWTSADPKVQGHNGRTNRSNDDWTSDTNRACDLEQRLYC